MSPTASPGDWKRLGELLTRRRVELNPRYANRTVFCDERALNYRLVYDIEEGKRGNFRTTTLAAVAAAYAVTSESVAAALAGGALEPLPQPPRLSAVPPPPLPEIPESAEPDDDLFRALIAGRRDQEVLWAIKRMPDNYGTLLPWEERRRQLMMWIRDQETPLTPESVTEPEPGDDAMRDAN